MLLDSHDTRRIKENNSVYTRPSITDLMRGIMHTNKNTHKFISLKRFAELGKLYSPPLLFCTYLNKNDVVNLFTRSVGDVNENLET